MAIGLSLIAGRPRVTLYAASILLVMSFRPAGAQEQDVKDEATTVVVSSKSGAAPVAKAGADSSPLAVPADASAEELFEFIRSVKRKRGAKNQSVMEAARAVVTAAETIRRLEEVNEDDVTRAIRELVPALSFLARHDEGSRTRLIALVDDLAEEKLELRIPAARCATREQQQRMVSDLNSWLADREFDREAYALAFALARAIGKSESVDLAASLYEDMAVMVSESEDKSLSSRVGKMVGAARRMRLPGNFMEVTGTTTEGKEFDWHAYRGKVVLVDFWASWSGPCRREVPNMKRNLTDYGGRGFEIVGINLDRTLEACEKYVQQEGLSWTNLMSDQKGERGWDNPLATHYGISATPTAILVDQEGKVVSLAARGKELDRLLTEMLGEPEPSEDETKLKVVEKLEDSDS